MSSATPGNPQWVIGNVERKTERYERGIQIEDRSAGVVGFSNGLHWYALAGDR